MDFSFGDGCFDFAARIFSRLDGTCADGDRRCAGASLLSWILIRESQRELLVAAGTAAFLVGDDVVYLRRCRSDGGRDVFPGPWLVLGLAVELSCRLSRWGRFRGACAWPSRWRPSSFLLALAISPVKDFLREWKHYKRAYVRFAQTRPDTKRLLADYRPEIDQIWIPDMGVVDRCTTCHQGITQASLLDASVPQPFRAHPPIPHPGPRLGLYDVPPRPGSRHGSGGGPRDDSRLGAAAPAGAFHSGILRHLPPRRSAETPQLDRGRQLLVQFNCVGCHRVRDVERPEMLGPDLTNVGTKVSRQWIYKWLKEPRTVTDASGNVTVNGYETGRHPADAAIPAD